MATPPKDSFQRYENWRDSVASLTGVSKTERWTSPHTHPGASVVRTAIVKLRVLAMFTIRRIAQGAGRRKALSGMRSLRNSARGKTILVVGNGPSANHLNVTEVVKAQESGGLIVVATNHYFSSPHARRLTPDFIIWADDVFQPRKGSDSEESWRELTIRPGTTLVCPWTWRKLVPKTGLKNPVKFFDNDTLETWSKNISPLRPRGYQGTTGAKALAFALHLGGSPVQMIGIDLSYIKNVTVNIDNKIVRHPTHVSGTDSGNQDLTAYSLAGIADLLYSTANQFLAFHTHFRGHNIVNLDPDSLVDAFPKVNDSPFVGPRPPSGC
jgi:hypothetical protein